MWHEWSLYACVVRILICESRRVMGLLERVASGRFLELGEGCELPFDGCDLSESHGCGVAKREARDADRVVLAPAPTLATRHVEVFCVLDAASLARRSADRVRMLLVGILDTVGLPTPPSADVDPSAFLLPATAAGAF